MVDAKVPVIAIDGPAGSGKGTVAKLVAAKLDFHILDSGLLYRVIGYQVLQAKINVDDPTQVDKLVMDLADDSQLWQPQSLSLPELRTPAVTAVASATSKIASVRKLLLPVQRSFRQLPGLVADGRDIGTVVFSDATVKIFLTASEQARAERRAKQLQDVTIDGCLSAIRQRDLADRSRQLAPMVAAADAVVIDSTELKPEAIVSQIVGLFQHG